MAGGKYQNLGQALSTGIGNMFFHGDWDATNNVPALSDATGSKGDVYLITVTGTVDLGSGSRVYNQGNFVVHDGDDWQIIGTGSAYEIVDAGEFTTEGGDANERIVVAAAVATDIALVTLHTAGSTPRTVTSAAAGAGDVDVVMSGDPSTDHVLSYLVLRASAEA